MSKQQQAAADLEALSVLLKETVTLLRESDATRGYAAIYELRTRLGKIVSGMGAGLPVRTELKEVRDIFDCL